MIIQYICVITHIFNQQKVMILKEQLKLTDKFEYEGLWWLPDNQGGEIAGNLLFDPDDGATLKLIGSFKSIQDLNTSPKYEVIFGISTNGKYITLYNCMEIRCSLNLPGLLVSQYYVDTIIMGGHFLKPADIQFKKVSVMYQYLNEWVNISAFEMQRFKEPPGVKIICTLPRPISTRINDKLIVSFDFEASASTRSVVQKEVYMEQRTVVNFESSEGLRYQEFFETLKSIQNVLSFAVKRYVYPLRIVGSTKTNNTVDSNSTENSNVELFYKIRNIQRVDKPILPNEMLFTFKDVSGRLEEFLGNWFKKRELLDEAFSTYFDTLYNPHMYQKQKFLALTQTIESYHQRVCDGKYVSDEEYEKVYDKLVENIPNEIKGSEDGRNLAERLKEYLRYGNELSLRRRLKDILNTHKAVFTGLIEDEAEFINDVINTRNYFTHYNEKLREEAASGADLFYLTEKLKILVETCLLSELGFRNEEISSFFHKNRNYRHLINTQ